MLRTLVVILLSMMILSLALKDLFTYSNFYLNQEFITNNHCVNKDRPELQCHGVCYLKKTVKENQQEKENLPIPVEENTSITVYLLDHYHFDTGWDIPFQKNFIVFPKDLYSYSHLSDIFRPPRIIS